jgi:hypothetical protein
VHPRAVEGRDSALPVLRSLCCAPCVLPVRSLTRCALCALSLCRVWCALVAHLPLRAPFSLGACLCASRLSLHLTTQTHSAQSLVLAGFISEARPGVGGPLISLVA